MSDIVNRITRRNKNNECTLPLTISAQYGLVDQISFFNKTIASADLSNYYLLYNGDFAYNKSYSTDYEWGAVKRLDRYDKGCLSSLYIVFRPKEDLIYSDYLTHYFETKKWHRGISDIAGEGARNHGLLNMSVEDYFATKHYLPEITEQKKIASFLNLITKRIETQSKIIENIKYYKKIISDNFLYSKDTISYKPLKEFGKVKNGYAFKSENYVENGLYNIITIANVSGDKYIQTKECNKIKDLPNDIQKHQVLQENDILISLTGNVGRVSLATNGQHLLNQRVGLFELFDKNLTEYIYQCLSNKTFEKSMTLKGQGAAQLNIGKDDIENYLIPQPNNESKKVISLLSYIDKKISIEYSLLQKYREQKSFLLSNMFI